MARFLMLFLALSFTSLSVTGCSEKAKVEKKTTVSTPEGTTTKTDTSTVESSGKNPPAANP